MQSPSSRWRAAGIVLGLALQSCAASDVSEHNEPPIAPAAASSPWAMRRWADPLASLPHGSEHTRAVCARPGQDAVRGLFCASEPPAIGSIADLRTALRTGSGYSMQGFSGVAMTAHTTALSARSVSSINPRVISLRLDINPRPDLIAIAFARGEQMLELVSRDYGTGQLAFYVLGFEQACNHAAQGCKPGDLLTPAVETDWLALTLYDELDLANSVLDCATCHQPDGPGTNKLLRMNELQSPWTHWFYSQSDGGRALFEDYLAAKGDEPLAGIAGAELLGTRPDSLEGFTRFGGFGTQPDEFDSRSIEAEVRATAPAQPADNSLPGVSATWRSLFERARRGEAPAVPYHDVKVTDPAKLARASAAYSAFRAGELSPQALPDIRDVFPDDEARLAEMGMATTPGAAGEAVLLEACSLCHNAHLDQRYSRARFRADLLEVDRAERDEAIRRLQLPPDDPAVMPPARLRVLSENARARAIEALQR